MIEFGRNTIQHFFDMEVMHTIAAMNCSRSVVEVFMLNVSGKPTTLFQYTTFNGQI